MSASSAPPAASAADRPKRSRRAAVTDGAVAAAYAAGWGVLKIIPHRAAAAAFRLGADLAYRRDGKGVRRLRSNLRRVVPHASDAELEELTRRGMRSYARYWLETFRLPVMDKADVARRVTVGGIPGLDEARAAGRGIIIALPHMGNYDVAGLWLIGHHGPFTTVAERLRPDSVFKRFVAYRESIGMEVLPLGPGEDPPSKILTERLRAGETVCLVADRDLTESGVEVTFFGEKTRMPAGPAYLAAITGAALMPLELWFDGDDWAMSFLDPISVAEGVRLRDRVANATQRLADQFERGIADHPEDWHMLQRMWPERGDQP
jgi:KDO2-lipid IV(A) lauroyltransferase